ncbi:hypothetical protein C8R43DRAFT_963909 [Mycena crocata]|nr:hypothetical protein C8R43DRAFT_963909 [Mycena crocata]
MATSDLRRHLVNIDAAILVQKSTLDALESDHTAIQREIDASATYPVVTLPVEITTEIFIHHLSISVDNNRSKSEREYLGPIADIVRPTAPMILPAVCRARRDISLVTPALWSTLTLCFVDVPHHIASKSNLIEEFIDRWVDRAAQRPLSLAFLVSLRHTFSRQRRIDDWADGPFAAHRLRGVIHRHSHRVHHLELAMSEHEIQQLGLDSAVFPLLESAILGCEEGPTPDLDIPPANVFVNAPRLHKLNVVPMTTTSDVILTVNHFALPWLQLTKFEGTIQNLNFFRDAPNLEQVTCMFNLAYFSPPVSPITHLRLHTLTLLLDSDDILQHLNLPSLHSLDISDMEGYYDTLESFLVRCSPPLVSLVITAEDNVWLKCVECLGHTLEMLSIDFPSEKQMLAIFSHSTPILLPNLRNLSLKNCPWTGSYYEHLLDFLSSRSDTLHSFRLDWCSRPLLEGPIWNPHELTHDTIVSRLSNLANTAGMAIHVGVESDNYVEHSYGPEVTEDVEDELEDHSGDENVYLLESFVTGSDDSG